MTFPILLKTDIQWGLKIIVVKLKSRYTNQGPGILLLSSLQCFGDWLLINEGIQTDKEHLVGE